MKKTLLSLITLLLLGAASCAASGYDSTCASAAHHTVTTTGFQPLCVLICDWAPFAYGAMASDMTASANYHWDLEYCLYFGDQPMAEASMAFILAHSPVNDSLARSLVNPAQPQFVFEFVNGSGGDVLWVWTYDGSRREDLHFISVPELGDGQDHSLSVCYYPPDPGYPASTNAHRLQVRLDGAVYYDEVYNYRDSLFSGNHEVDFWIAGQNGVMATEQAACWATYSCQNPLAMDFYGMEAQNLEDSVRLRWSLSSDLPVEACVVERSVDGFSFEAIGAVTSVAGERFQFVDRTPPAGILLYRIVARDKGDAYLNSPVMVVETEGGKPQENDLELALVFPSIVEAGPPLRVRTRGPLEYQVLGMDGKLVGFGALPAGEGEVSTEGWASGIYLLRARAAGETRTWKVMVR